MRTKDISSCLFVLSFGIYLSLVSGCGKKDIQGVVQDPFGKGIEDVEVQIVNTTFMANSDKEGHYAIDYVPGTFTVKYSKPGYTTHHLNLTIEQRSKFPAAMITVYPLPSGEGIFYMRENEVVPLARKPIRENEIRTGRGWNSSAVFEYYTMATDEEPFEVKPGTARFVFRLNNKERANTEYLKAALLEIAPQGALVKRFRIKSRVEMYYSNGVTFDMIYSRNQSPDSLQAIGEEQLLVGYISLQPGLYAWVFDKGRDYGISMPCYPFIVKSEQADTTQHP